MKSISGSLGNILFWPFSGLLLALPASTMAANAASPPQKTFCMAGVCLGDTYAEVRASKGMFLQQVPNYEDSTYRPKPHDLKEALLAAGNKLGQPLCTTNSIRVTLQDPDKFTYGVTFTVHDPSAAPELAFRVVAVDLSWRHGAGENLSQDAREKAITSLRDRMKMKVMPASWRPPIHRRTPEWFYSVDVAAKSRNTVSVILSNNYNEPGFIGARLGSEIWRDSVVLDHKACGSVKPKL